MVVAEDKTLRARLREVRSRIVAASQRSSRAPEDITLVAVSKTHPASLVREAIDLGVTDLGENRVQEAETKMVEVDRPVARWHLIGHLQANKARRAAKLFDVVHSLDSAPLALRLERSCVEEGKPELRVLLQVDLAGEATKSGVAVADLPELVKVVSGCSRLRLTGLMVLPPFLDDPEGVRPFFRRLRGLRDELKSGGHFAEESGELSMGMSHDFEVAIEEGATLIRVGTAIFGERERTPAI